MSEAENLREHKWFGKLHPEEVALAREVFGETIPYERIFISDTKSKTQGITLATSPRRSRAKYLLLWSSAYKTNIAVANEHMRQTFIHELTHVWQSQHTGLTAMSYMTRSAWHQFTYGVRDIYKNGFFSGTKRMLEIIGKNFTNEWGVHRNYAYCFNSSDIGKDFRSFNVEQQALIIESWFAKHPFFVNEIQYQPGKQSKDDPRFPYVRDCIRPGDPDAVYQKLL